MMATTWVDSVGEKIIAAKLEIERLKEWGKSHGKADAAVKQHIEIIERRIDEFIGEFPLAHWLDIRDGNEQDHSRIAPMFSQGEGE